MSESVGIHERVNSRETCSMSESVGVHERANSRETCSMSEKCRCT